MSGIRTQAAALMLGVSASTLRSWERRYGFPCPHRSSGGHRQYGLEEIEALRAALADTQNVSSAVALARKRGSGLASEQRLEQALRMFDEEAANRLLEESLAVRSVERTIEELLLSAVEAIDGDPQAQAEFEFAWRYGTGWLAALKRLAPPAQRPDGVLVVDGAPALSVDALHGQALELILRRSGLRTLTLSPAVDPARLGRALRALTPAAVVLTGGGMELDAIGRTVYAIRRARPGVLVLDFRGAIPESGASMVARLGHRPVEACQLLLARLRDAGDARPAPRVHALA